MSFPTVSVVIPSYNHAQFVCEAIDSVLGQTFTDLEVLVVDDGSTDDTRQRVAAYGQRVRYLYQENRGLSAARNAGIREAKGDWVAMLDADDVWHRELLQRMMLAADRFPDAMVLGAPPCTAMPERLPDNPSIRPVDVKDFLVSTPITGSSTLVRRECFATAGLFEESLTSVEDRDMWLRLAARFPAYCVETPGWRYRQHAGQMSRRAGRMLTNYRRVLAKFFHEHPQWMGLYSLAVAQMHADAAVCYFEEGNRMRAIGNLLLSAVRHPRAIAPERRLRRTKQLVRFLLGDAVFTRLKPRGRTDVAK